MNGRSQRRSRSTWAGSPTGGPHFYPWISVALAALAALSLLLPSEGWAQKPSRDEVEAAYLYNFGKFVRWPGGSDQGPLVVCVEDQESFGQAVAKLVEGDQINGRPVEERGVDGPAAIGACSILFVGTGEHERVESFLAAAEGRSILTVGDAPNFLRQGGMIQFVLIGDHLRFSVNLEAVNRHRMALSSELLKVAVMVTGNGGTGGAK